MRQPLIKYILDANVELPSKEVLRGTITTNDDEEYHFVNRSTDLDFYVYLKKGEHGWYKSNGQEIETPQSMIDELGYQVDKFLIENPKLNNVNLSNGSGNE